MNWGCPHLEEERCDKLRKSCHPTQKGCVLHGQVRLQPSPVLEQTFGDGRSRGKIQQEVKDERRSVVLKTGATTTMKRRK
jgi:hypothetical protein